MSSYVWAMLKHVDLAMDLASLYYFFIALFLPEFLSNRLQTLAQ